MREERLNQDYASLTESSATTATDALEQRMVRVLDMHPEVAISEGFAARVASQLPIKQPISLTPTRYGRNAMLISMAVLLIALLALAPHIANNSVLGLTLEWTLCGQFTLLIIWFGAQRRSLH